MSSPLPLDLQNGTVLCGVVAGRICVVASAVRVDSLAPARVLHVQYSAQDLRQVGRVPIETDLNRPIELETAIFMAIARNPSIQMSILNPLSQSL